MNFFPPISKMAFKRLCNIFSKVVFKILLYEHSEKKSPMSCHYILCIRRRRIGQWDSLIPLRLMNVCNYDESNISNYIIYIIIDYIKPEDTLSTVPYTYFDRMETQTDVWLDRKNILYFLTRNSCKNDSVQCWEFI